MGAVAHRARRPQMGRNVAIAEKVLQTLESMNPQYPTADFDPTKIEIDE